jgi:UDP-3-O-[3-hydroxymyristoyl] N-acetylglucosamine deacetylase
MMARWEQTTLATEITITGIGVHSGAPVEMILKPAPAGSGYRFLRTGLADGKSRMIPAHVDLVGPTELCTVLGDTDRGAVSTVEHLLAALRGLGVDNVLIEVDGPELPIVDGSAQPFVEAIDAVGLIGLDAPRRVIKILKPVRVEQGRAWGELLPTGRSGFRMEVEIDFPDAVIGRQALVVDLTPKSFRKELANARTFGFLKDVEKLLPLGFAQGSSLDNTVVVDGERVLNPTGLRARDEFVRHKTLDAVGDLALIGLPIEGAYRSYCGGHRLNVAVGRALLADLSAWTVVETRPLVSAGRGQHIAALQPAFAPEIH